MSRAAATLARVGVISEETERIERETLSPFAQLAAESKGRERPEERDPLRTCYQRDRDRIIHSKAFRRLRHKAQVFLAPVGDHIRVRLTHTLEVAQIARTIARALRLNEDLTEAVALGHDLGHTPFGHIGEEVLTRLLGVPFRHAEQSLRVVEVLEYGGRGLNLTVEVRDGIVNHTWSRPPPTCMEGQVVRFADRIAYVNHDLDDGVRAGVIGWDDVPAGLGDALGRSNAQRINTLVMAVVEASAGRPQIGMAPAPLEAMDTLRAFLFERVYLAEATAADRAQAVRVVETLFKHYVSNPEALPSECQRIPGDLCARVADYVAGMTDGYAARRYEEIR